MAKSVPDRRDPWIPYFAGLPPQSSLLPAKPYLHSRGSTSPMQVWITGMYRGSSQNALSQNGYGMLSYRLFSAYQARGTVPR
eukprot:14829427-Heterocapsa_arctica.AAC.1